MQPTFYPAPQTTADLNLQRRVLLTLGQLHVPRLRFLRVEVADGIVTLSGRVGSYYERQLAQSRARRVPGVVRLVDALTVIERPSRPSGLANLLTRRVSNRQRRGIDDLVLAAVAAADHVPQGGVIRRSA
ncbi:MAG TPA: BON domain-containing protein [Pirellulales bacterium]